MDNQENEEQKNETRGYTQKFVEGFDIYVQTEPFPCNKVAAHPCGEGISQKEARAALSGYLLGIKKQQPHALIKPFFVSQASSQPMWTDLIKEIAKYNYALPKNFDPIIFAVNHSDEENFFIKKSGEAWTIEWELNFFFNMIRIEKDKK